MNNKYISFLLIIPAILIGIWFWNGNMLAGAEDGIPLYNPSRTVNLYRYAWMPISFGVQNATMHSITPYYYFCSYLMNLGIPAHYIQAITFYIIMISAGLSVYFIAKILFKKENNLYTIAFLSAIFYLLNPFVFISVWQRFVYPFYFSLSILPLSLSLFLLGIKKRSFNYIFPFCLISLIFSGVFVVPIFVVTLFSVILFFFIYVTKINKNNILHKKFEILYLLNTIIFWPLTNSWWLIILFAQGPEKYNELVTPEQNIQSLISVSKNQGLIYIVRLINFTHLFQQKLWGDIYSSIPFQLISAIIPITVFATLILYRKSSVIKFLIILTIFSLFVTNGTNFPFGSIFKFFFKYIGILQGFRNPFEKYGIVLSFVFSLIFGLGITNFTFYLKNKYKTLKVLMFPILICSLLFIVYIHPMWTGSVFGGNKINYKIVVPNYYQQVADRINFSENRVVSLPFLTGGGVRYLWKKPYLGMSPGQFILPVQEISEVFSLPKDDQKIVFNMWEWYYTKDFWKLMHLTGSQYLILHKDIDYSYSNYAPYNYVKQFLSINQRPNKHSELSVSPCTTWEQFKDSVSNNLSLRCKIDERYRDWTDLSYFHLNISSNVTGKVHFIASSKNHVNAYWGDLPQGNYNIFDKNVNSENKFIISIKSIYNRYSNFDLSNVEYFYAYINSSDPININSDIDIVYNFLDKGIDKKVDNIVYVQKFGDLDLYELNTEYVTPKIFTSSSIRKVNDFDEILRNLDTNFLPITALSYVTMDQDVSVNLSGIESLKLDQPLLTYTKVDPTFYKIKIRNANRHFLIIFNETYHPEWKLFINSDEVGKHFKINGYSNAFLVDKNGDYEMELKYDPQKYIAMGIKLSVFGYAIMLPLLLITSRINMIKRSKKILVQKKNMGGY